MYMLCDHPISRFLDPKNDIAFRKVFGSEKNKDILIHFINDILGFKGNKAIQTVEFLNPIQDPEIAAKKESIVDVLCKDRMGTQYIVEMQVELTLGFEKRAQYYAAKAYCRQTDRGKGESGRYANLKEIIFIAISNYILFPEKKLNIVLVGNGGLGGVKYDYRSMFGFGLYGLYQYLFSAPALSNRLYVDFIEEYLRDTEKFDRKISFFKITSIPEKSLSPTDIRQKNVDEIRLFGKKMLQDNLTTIDKAIDALSKNRWN